MYVENRAESLCLHCGAPINNAGGGALRKPCQECGGHSRKFQLSVKGAREVKDIDVDVMREAHKKYLRVKHEFLCDTTFFTPDEVDLITRLGTWMNMLCSAEIEPISEAQIQFLDVHNGFRRPKTKFELTWVKYRSQTIYELGIRLQKDLHEGKGVDYEILVEVFSSAANHEHREATKWLEKEGRTSLAAARSLDFPDIGRSDVNQFTHPCKGSWVTKPQPSDDWSDVKDDFDAGFWDEHMGGPDDPD